MMRADSPNLDVLRSIAVLSVVASHLFLDAGLVDEGGYHSQSLGTLGVMIFFVHTCLVLMLSLERQALRDYQRPGTIEFLVRRAFRIYPLSILVVVLVVSIPALSSGTPPTAGTVISNLLLVQNITGHNSVPPVLWSLPFEFQMYVFLPSLFALVAASGKRAPFFIGALWTAMIMLVLALWRLGWSFELIRYFPCFLPGVLAFSLRDSRRKLPPGMLFGFIAVSALIFPWMVGHGAKATILAWPFCLMLGLIIPRCRELQPVWLHAFGRQIARYSYGIYLVHVPMLNLAFHHSGLPASLQWLLFFGGVAGLSYAAYHAIEKPGIDFGKSLADRLAIYRMAPKRNV